MSYELVARTSCPTLPQVRLSVLMIIIMRFFNSKKEHIPEHYVQVCIGGKFVGGCTDCNSTILIVLILLLLLFCLGIYWRQVRGWLY